MKKIVKTPIITAENDMVLSLPTTVHIELTSSCCFGCRHCYNFWRQQEARPIFMSRKQLSFILDELIKNKITHVIFTGGEPLLNEPVLFYGISQLKEAGISVSCNSTLAVANSLRQLEKLKKAGLEHILTSLNSYKPEINDYLVSSGGALHKITEGIRQAVSTGIRISVNMIISESNIKDIYATAEFVHRLGAKKFFGTRVVPHIHKKIGEQKEFLISEEHARYIIEELIKAENDFGLQVGTLVPFPLCFLFGNGKDRERYANFYSHGCPAGNRMLSLNANGDAHACVHEERSYGNIFEIGIKGVWENMKEWRSGEFVPDTCKICPLFDECNGGCRLCAQAYRGNISCEDNLMIEWDSSVIEYDGNKDSGLGLTTTKCRVPDTLNFRKEDGFYVIKRFGSEILCVKNDIAKILIDYQKRQVIFSPAEAGLNDIDTVKVLLKERLLTEAPKKPLFKDKGSRVLIK